MPMRYPVTASEIHTATYATIAALKSLDLDCCLVGSVACAAYGMSRRPNDIDMVVLTSEYTQEELKRRVVNHDSRFYLVASKDPNATYQVLWFRLPGYYRSCKVDLLLPGIMNIPSVSSNRIYCIRDNNTNPSASYLSSLFADYPLMPFLPLLLLKLQAWQDHGESTKSYMRMKQPTDVQDILELLRIADRKYAVIAVSDKNRSVRHGSRHTVPAPQEARMKRTLLDEEISHLPASFIRDARARVRKFTRLYSSSAGQWRSIGFEVEDVERTADNLRVVRGDVGGLESAMRSLRLGY